MPPVAGNWFVALRVETGTWWSRVTAPPQGVRLFAPEDVHITVAFLGPVGAVAAQAAFDVAPRWPGGPFDVSLTSVVAMGNPRRPSALSVLVGDGVEELTHAILAVRDEMLERAGCRRDDRPPLPHATIARPERSAGHLERERALAWAKSIELGNPRVRLSHLALYTRADDRRVRLFREHACYELIRRSAS